MHRAYPGLEPRETWATRPTSRYTEKSAASDVKDRFTNQTYSFRGRRHQVLHTDHGQQR